MVNTVKYDGTDSFPVGPNYSTNGLEDGSLKTDVPDTLVSSRDLCWAVKLLVSFRVHI